MSKLRISSSLAVIVGIALLIWGSRMSPQKDANDQTDREFVTQYAMTVGGGLIALVGAFGAGRTSRK